MMPWLERAIIFDVRARPHTMTGAQRGFHSCCMVHGKPWPEDVLDRKPRPADGFLDASLSQDTVPASLISPVLTGQHLPQGPVQAGDQVLCLPSCAAVALTDLWDRPDIGKLPDIYRQDGRSHGAMLRNALAVVPGIWAWTSMRRCYPPSSTRHAFLHLSCRCVSHILEGVEERCGAIQRLPADHPAPCLAFCDSPFQICPSEQSFQPRKARAG